MRRIVDWIRSVKADKWLHLLCGLGVAQVAFALLSLALPWWGAALSALAMSAVVGGIKELVDVKWGVPSWKDFAWTCAGGLIGVLLLIPMAI
jgi:hypothetical protein